nr:ribonuclease H-like domain-containing protein [Tanacetum cinerariifolium]
MAIGSLFVTDFFQEIKSKADRLANLNSPVKDTSLVTYAVNGIRSKYPDATRGIRLQEKAPTFDVLRSMMPLEESDMSHQSVSSTLLHNTPSSPTILVASTTPTDKANTMSTSGFDVCRNFQHGSCSYGARCKFVHGANDLRPRPYYQFDTSRSNATHFRDSCFTTGRMMFPNYAISSSYLPQATTLPQAFQTITLQQPNWNMDTRASSHLAENTCMLTSFINPSLYKSVYAGNGQPIPVTHTGHSTLQTPHKPLHLHHVFVTPNIIKNLIYVHQFTRDNNVSDDFDSYGFSVKDYQTRQLLLHCDSTGDLYPVTHQPLSSTPFALISLSLTTWHRRLGHPSEDMLRHLESSRFISCNKTKLSALCHACQLGKHTRLPFYSSESNVASVFDIVHSDLWTSPISSESDQFLFGSMTPDQPPYYDFLLPPPNTQITNPPNHHLSTGTPTPSIHIPTQPHPSQLHSTPHLGPTNEPVTLTEPTTPDPTCAPTSPSPTPNTHLTTPVATTSSNSPKGPTTNTHHIVTCAKAGISKPLARMNCHVITTSHIPRSHLHVLRGPHWHKAMVDEYNALISNGMWALMPRPANVNVVRPMWLFRHKYNADGSLNRYKARLVANGHSQQYGIDYDETFSTIVKADTIHIVSSLAVTRDWPIHQLDVKNDFLHGQLSKTVYMYQPPGFVDFTHPDYRSKSGLFLSQSKFATEILERAHMQHCNPCKTHVTLSLSLVLMVILSVTLLYIAALQRILRYVRGTLDHDLQLHVSSASQLTAFTDADWVTLSRSSTEAEYRGVANVVAETVWIRNLLLELHAPLTTATLVYCDNVSAVYLSTNPIQHQRTKHIEIDIHFVRDYVASGQVRVLHVSSRFQYVDIFTTGLLTALFLEFRSNLNVRRPPVPTPREYLRVMFIKAHGHYV